MTHQQYPHPNLNDCLRYWQATSKYPKKYAFCVLFFGGGIGSILAPGVITQKNNTAPDVR
jgi:hypothetical protein